MGKRAGDGEPPGVTSAHLAEGGMTAGGVTSATPPIFASGIAVDVNGRPLTAPAKVWIVFLLALMGLFAAIDRSILSVLLVPIQEDLQVSDSAMGILTGSSFAIVNGVASFPLALLADRVNRRDLMAAAVGFWSLATVACGLTATYWQLFLCRIGVAAGEAAQMPSSLSVIGDALPQERRGTALSALFVGSVLGFSAGSAIAGTLAEAYGWRTAVVAVGLPGLLLALIIRLTMREPARGTSDAGAAAVVQLSVAGTLRRIARIRTLIPLTLGGVFMSITTFGWLTWMPTFLMRTHGLGTAEMSRLYGLLVGVGAVVAVLYSGYLSDRLARRSPRARARFMGVMTLAGVPFMVAGLMVDDLTWAMLFLLIYILLAGGLPPVMNATFLSVAPVGIRASVSALSALAVSVFGGGLGPLLIGVVSDALKVRLGAESIRYVLLFGASGLVLASLCFHIAVRFVDEDAKAALRG